MDSQAQSHPADQLRWFNTLGLASLVTVVGFALTIPGANAAQADANVPAASEDDHSITDDLMHSTEAELLHDSVGIDLPGSVSPTGATATASHATALPVVPGITPGWGTPVKKFGISAVYGEAGGWSSGHHTGLDFTASEGTPVLAVNEGTVISSEFEGAYGNLVRIRHSNGLQTWYAHLAVSYVKKGDKVALGQKIGRVGMTGRTFGPHVHLEVRKTKDVHVDPARYVWVDKKIPKKVKRG